MIWLRFLAEPVQHAELLRSLLPHRFSGGEVDAKGVADDPIWDGEVEAFLQSYRGLRAVAHNGGTKEQKSQRTWEVLVRRVVSGSSSQAESGMNRAAEESIEQLMRSLEQWSMELQRHCPEDWNQCSSILVQCLTRPSEKPKLGAFRV